MSDAEVLEAKTTFLKMCEWHRQFSSDEDTEQDIQERIAASRRAYEKVIEKNKKLNETLTERLDRLRLRSQSRVTPNVFLSHQLDTLAKQLEAQCLVPQGDIGNLGINHAGDMILSSRHIKDLSGSLWCFRDIHKYGVAAGPSFVTRINPQITEYQVDAQYKNFAVGNTVAVGKSEFAFQDVIHINNHNQTVFFADGGFNIGIAKYNFLDQIRTDSVRQTMPQTRVEMAEELQTGLFDTLATTEYMPEDKVGRKLMALSAFKDNKILGGCGRGTFMLWDPVTFSLAGHVRNTFEDSLSAFQVLHDESCRSFIAADIAKYVKVFDMRKSNPVVRIQYLEDGFIMDFGVPESTQNTYFLAGTNSGNVHLFDLRNLKGTIDSRHIGDRGPTNYLKFSPSGEFFCVAKNSSLFVIPHTKEGISPPLYSYQSKRHISSVAMDGTLCYTTEIPGRVVFHEYGGLCNLNGKRRIFNLAESSSNNFLPSKS